MRSLGILALAVAVALGADADRQLARAQAHAKRGQEALAKAGTQKTGAPRLHALGRAEYYLERAEGLAAKTADLKLQGDIRKALVETEIQLAAAHYERKSLPRAKAKADRALVLDPGNAKAKAILAAIKKAEDTDIFESVDGVVAISRIKARRLEVGAPLRDRGLSRRR